jgi:hypothetical protein
MKRGKRRFWVWLLKLSVAALAFYLLVRGGLNPFWSVLVLLYWKTAILLGLFVVGLAYFAHTVMN